MLTWQTKFSAGMSGQGAGSAFVSCGKGRAAATRFARVARNMRPPFLLQMRFSPCSEEVSRAVARVSVFARLDILRSHPVFDRTDHVFKRVLLCRRVAAKVHAKVWLQAGSWLPLLTATWWRGWNCAVWKCFETGSCSAYFSGYGEGKTRKCRCCDWMFDARSTLCLLPSRMPEKARVRKVPGVKSEQVVDSKGENLTGMGLPLVVHVVDVVQAVQDRHTTKRFSQRRAASVHEPLKLAPDQDTFRLACRFYRVGNENTTITATFKWRCEPNSLHGAQRVGTMYFA